MLLGTRYFEKNPGQAPFFLTSGQKLENRFIYNGSWFNARGEWIGSGDLSIEDLKRIASELPNDELFIIVTEGDGQDWSREVRNRPGIAALSLAAGYVIYRGLVYNLDRGYFRFQNLTFHRLSRVQIADLISRLGGE